MRSSNHASCSPLGTQVTPRVEPVEWCADPGCSTGAWQSCGKQHFSRGHPAAWSAAFIISFGSELAAEQGRMVEGLVGEKQSQMGFKSSPAKFPGSKMQLMWLTLKFLHLHLFSDTLSRIAWKPDERFCRHCSVKPCSCNLHLFIYIFTRYGHKTISLQVLFAKQRENRENRQRWR